MFGLVLVMLVQAGALPDPTIVRDGARWRIEVPAYDTEQEVDIRTLMETRAAAQCGRQVVDWGRFETETVTSAPGSGRPSRTKPSIFWFRCGEPPAPPPAMAIVADDWQPDAAEIAAARSVAESYWAAAERGDFDAAGRLFEPGILDDVPGWIGDQRDALAEAGATDRRIGRTSWYVNEPAAPQAGVFVAFDYRAVPAKMALECGYLILYRSAPGVYRLFRTETNRLAKGGDDAQVAAFRASYCPI